MRSVLFALALTCVAIAGAHADGLKASNSHSVDLGSVRGVAYYTIEKDGTYRVVVTVAPEEAASPVRFIARLHPEETLTMSVPGDVGSPEAIVEIARRGDEVLISPAHPVTH